MSKSSQLVINLPKCQLLLNSIIRWIVLQEGSYLFTPVGDIKSFIEEQVMTQGITK
jgi:hypothetical protein